MRLIVTEKNNSAKKIADILSGGEAKDDATYKVPFYTWSDSDGEQMAIGLKGHVMNPSFPEGYSNWQKTDLHELIDAALTKEPTDKNVLRAIRKVANDATSVVIATDYDREGELIGLEALDVILDVKPELEGSVHRPDLGRDADPCGLAGHAPLRLQLPLGRARTEPDPRPDRRARARAPSPRRQALLGGVRTLPASRRIVRGPPRHRPLLGEDRGGRGAGRDEDPRHRQRGKRQTLRTKAAGSLQYDRVHHRGLEPPRNHPEARHAARRGPLHGRLHLLPAHRQHRLSALAAHR
ncbi:MAG: hypothetical protein E6G48_03925 [Actinobacteria bacterium]|nr:MAG: hypothetical protein E6G48_03925 [Actinomycetota bacterium]